MEDKFKSGFVTLIGRPNVGKSTLMNQIIGQKIAITSAKPQTTRNRIQTVYTDDNGQIIFLDTPGLHKAKNKLGEYMVTAAKSTLNEVDVICWLVEVGTFIGEGDRAIAEMLEGVSTPVILIINKIDTVKPEEILKSIDKYKELYEFKEIVPVSAMTGENSGDVVNSIMKYLEEGPMYFDPDTITDQPERQITAEIIREKALMNLNDEIPHGIAVEIDSMKFRKKGNIYDIDATIICERDSHKRIIIGKGGSMIKKIGAQARKDIEVMLGEHVNLKLWVKVRKDWRNSDSMVRNFGYDKKKL
ncbi:MAG: GTPase Era [Lachnospiraceae bacterium]|nr:GTPase Era [Lachnospiraceae bacterium]